ncbi:MAG: helicase-related protein [Roseimicrobium sp.]
MPGQRWVSDTEPELGLGIVLKSEFGRVEMLFPAANEMRQYALKVAPLRRVQFHVGDTIKTHNGAEFVVSSVEERKGLVVYVTEDREVAEAELSDSISFSKPEDRLLGGQTDDLRTFALRVTALQQRSRIRQSVARGFVGGRVDLLPHQMFIAGEVASRLVPRVLLADEVGLGKTIEAGLILHRLHLTGRASRVLVLVPETLLHQWFVELLRRFNLMFSLYDEDRCTAMEDNEPEGNPFLESQLVLCSIGFLSTDEKRAAQVVAAGWDLLVVDEAHHLEWSPEQPSTSYALVAALAEKTPGLLLLTATPQQLGPEGHFARLRLLDAARYTDMERFAQEAGHYTEVARAVDRILEDKPLTPAERKLFAKQSERVRNHLEELAAGEAGAKDALVAALLDEFGTGRVMFRNTRAALSGFPTRQAKLVPLDADEDEGFTAKVKWLAALLRELGDEKVLLICRTRILTEQVHEALLREVNVSAAVFHEGLSLIQRDRNAASFANPDEDGGARILLCSEIGSEGRNFQFAHHLVLFDLPENVELLEQRIGRLDRIGQTSIIRIYVPYTRGTAGEVLARWFHDGMNAMEKNLHGAAEIVKELADEARPLLENFSEPALKKLITRSQKLCATVGKKLERGHDRLLELGSCKPDQAAQLLHTIRELDGDAEFEEFFIGLLDHFGMHIEHLSHRGYVFHPSHLVTDDLPSVPEEGLSVTFDRTRALSREDLGFLSIDHPLVRGSLDLLLGAESGNSAFAMWRGSGSEGLLLEAWFVVECVAPATLHADRFLPPQPVRIVLDHTKAEFADLEKLDAARLEKGDVVKLLDRGAVRKKVMPDMLKKANALATEKSKALASEAVLVMEKQLREEVERLQDLRQRNDHIRPEEIAAVTQQMEELRAAMEAARPRLDAVRLVWRMA